MPYRHRRHRKGESTDDDASDTDSSSPSIIPPPPRPLISGPLYSLPFQDVSFHHSVSPVFPSASTGFSLTCFSQKLSSSHSSDDEPPNTQEKRKKRGRRLRRRNRHTRSDPQSEDRATNSSLSHSPSQDRNASIHSAVDYMERVEGQSSRAIKKLLVIVEDLQRRISQLEPSSSTENTDDTQPKNMQQKEDEGGTAQDEEPQGDASDANSKHGEEGPRIPSLEHPSNSNDIAVTDDAHPKNIQQKEDEGSTAQDEDLQDDASDVNSEHGEGPRIPGPENDESTPKRQLTIATKFLLDNDSHQRASFWKGHFQTGELLKVLRGKPVPKASQLMDPQPGIESEAMDITAIYVDSLKMTEFFDQLAVSLCNRSYGGAFTPLYHTTFFKPFRFLLQYHGHIKEHVKLLAEKAKAQGEGERFAAHLYLRRMDQAYLDSSDTGGSQASEKAVHTPAAQEDGGSDQLGGDSGQSPGSLGLLPQLQHLLAFMDKALGAQLGLYEDYRQAKLKTIQFRDLWMLFKPGDIIYAPERRQKWLPSPRDSPDMAPTPAPGGFREGIGRTTPQAYKVIAVAGGRPFANNQLPPLFAAKKSNSYTPLKVLCYYVDFNGTRYDCVADTFKFAPFDGEVEIQSLEAYPLTYAHEPREPAVSPSPRDASSPRRGIVDFLQSRGRDFIRVSEASHRLYEGLTVGAKEEVSLLFRCFIPCEATQG